MEGLRLAQRSSGRPAARSRPAFSRSTAVRPKALLDQFLPTPPRWTQIKRAWAPPTNQKDADDKAYKLAVELVDLTAGSNCGLNTSADARKEIMAIVKQLERLGRKQINTGPELSAAWRVLWTTEKETLFILKNAPLFGTKADGVYQVVDTKSGWLQNVIIFPPDGAFVVNSDIRMAGSQRMAFNFTKANLYLRGDTKLPLPPFGSGWFESVYMGFDLRVAKDSRGDTLVCVRDGEAEKYE